MSAKPSRSGSIEDSMSKRLALILFLAMPFLVVGLLMWAIAASLEQQGQSVGDSREDAPASVDPSPTPAIPED